MISKHFTTTLALLLCGSILSAQSPQTLVKLKFGEGLQITAADSSMYLKASFRAQSLFEMERDLEDHSAVNSSFLVRRSRLKFEGWAFSPNLGYKVELGLANKDISSTSDFSQTSGAPKIILDAVLKWKLHKDLELWAGQTKLPGNRERVISSQALQFVDRSLVNSIFNLDRDMGIQLHGKLHMGRTVVKPIFSWSLGDGRNVTIDNIGGFDYTGRLEILPLGEFSKKGDYVSSDLYREASPKLAFGITYDFNNGSARQTSTGKFLTDTLGGYLNHDLQTLMVDAVFKYQGFSLMSEFAYKDVSDVSIQKNGENVPAELIDANGRSYYTGKGIVVQAGYLFKNNWEVATRYTQVKPNQKLSFKEQKEYTLGLSKYIVGHSLKVQSDVSLIDTAGKDANTLRYRLQFEFAF